MKVKELIEKLQAFDPELEVFVDGYEGGYDTPQLPFQSPMKLNVHTDENEWYYGKHELHRATDNGQPDSVSVIIPR
jgi:hypothetical protein